MDEPEKEDMSLFQCERCGCVENTACASQGFKYTAQYFDWTDIEDRKGKLLCSACGPTRFKDGHPAKYGKWHNQFKRTYLPMGMFRTAQNGNLEHIETGDQNYVPYILPDPYVLCECRITDLDGICVSCGRTVDD